MKIGNLKIFLRTFLEHILRTTRFCYENVRGGGGRMDKKKGHVVPTH